MWQGQLDLEKMVAVATKLTWPHNWGFWTVNYLYFWGSCVGWIPQGTGLYRWGAGPWAQNYCSPHAVASSWGCIHTDVTSHGLGCHWDVLGGSSGRAGPWYYGLNKREGIHSLPVAWWADTTALHVHVKGVTLGLSQHFLFLHRSVWKDLSLRQLYLQLWLEIQLGVWAGVAHDCLQNRYFPYWAYWRKIYLFCRQIKDLNLLELLSEYFVITLRYLRITVNHVQLLGWALCCSHHIKG